MNRSHYPSLDLCQKLTEIGFPETEKVYRHWRFCGQVIIDIKKKKYFDYKYDKSLFSTSYICYCPSVMEMIMYMIENNISTQGIPVDEYLPTYLANSIIEHKLGS